LTGADGALSTLYSVLQKSHLIFIFLPIPQIIVIANFDISSEPVFEFGRLRS
jgi:hypothetical protein